MNIKLWYLYRDGANYKRHNSVAFGNSKGLMSSFIEAQIREQLADGAWFSAKRWGLPDLHFDDWDEEIDHHFHEFDCIEETNDPDVKEDVMDLIERIKKVDREY